MKEPKQSCKEEGTRLPPQQFEWLIKSYKKTVVLQAFESRGVLHRFVQSCENLLFYMATWSRQQGLSPLQFFWWHDIVIFPLPTDNIYICRNAGQQNIKVCQFMHLSKDLCRLHSCEGTLSLLIGPSCCHGCCVGAGEAWLHSIS